MDDELSADRDKNPPLVDSERDLIAHLFDVLFTALGDANLLPDELSQHLVDYEIKRLRNGHANEDAA